MFTLNLYASISTTPAYSHTPKQHHTTEDKPPIFGGFRSGDEELPSGGFRSGDEELPSGGFRSGDEELPSGGFRSGDEELPSGGFRSGDEELPSGGFRRDNEELPSGGFRSGDEELPSGGFRSDNEDFNSDERPGRMEVTAVNNSTPSFPDLILQVQTGKLFRTSSRVEPTEYHPRTSNK